MPPTSFEIENNEQGASRMLALPDFRTSEDQQAWFKKHAEYFTCCCRVQGHKYRSEHRSVDDARAAAPVVARTLNKPCVIYACIGYSSEWVENVLPVH